MLLTKIFLASTFIVSIIALTPPSELRDGFYQAYINHDGHEVHKLVALPDGESLRAGEITEFITNKSPKIPKNPKKVIAREAKNNLRKRYYNGPDFGFQPGSWNANCGCGFNMDHGNCDAAVLDLEYQTRNGGEMDLGLAWYSIRGNVVAFACSNWPDSTDTWNDSFKFTAEDERLHFAAISRVCGSYVAGTGRFLDWSPVDYNHPFIGYMQWYSGLDFCAHATGSDADHC